MRAVITTVIACATIAGCATAPDQIAATPVAASAYAGRDCAALAGEFVRITTELDPLVELQAKARTEDVVGVLVVGLPVGSMARGGPKHRERDIARLKGEREAVVAQQRAMRCG